VCTRSLSRLRVVDVSIPEEAKKYIKQGRIMLAMFTGKLKTDKCKKAYDNMYKLIEDISEKPGKLTGRKLITPFCGIGDHCISEAIEVVTSMASSSEIIKNGINNYLKKQGMDLDTVVAGAPLMYMGICATYSSMEEQEKLEL
jgi:hypothetical protein